MTDEEVTRTRNDFEMMRRPHLWPRMYLPLINRIKKTRDGIGREGILFCSGKGEGGFIFADEQNIFLPIPEGKEFEYGGEEMLQRLVNEGWLVD